MIGIALLSDKFNRVMSMKKIIYSFAWFIAISAVILIILSIIMRADEIIEHFMDVIENRMRQEQSRNENEEDIPEVITTTVQEVYYMRPYD